MMKYISALLVVFVILVNTFAVPELTGIENISNKDHSRVKRLACDLLNPIQVLELNVGEALCANLCKLQGKAGGQCTPAKDCQCNQ